MRLLVTGSRAWPDRERIWAEIDAIAGDRITIIHGAAKGADDMAHAWAVAHHVDVIPFKAEWKRYDRPEKANPAGPIRNARMLREGKPDRGLAFGALWKPYKPTMRDGGMSGGKVCSHHQTRCIDYCVECKEHPPHKATGTGDMVRRMLAAGLPVRWIESPDAAAVDLHEMPGPRREG